MTITLDVITRKKLILVRQLYQRAALLAEAEHSYVDRIMALIGFDLTNETVLKAVVGGIDPSKTPSGDFQGIIRQADAALAAASLPMVPDQPKIQYVRSLRNDAQHKAKYPNETDVSDCRTYTRDFLQQLVSNVWGIDFNFISLTEIIQHPKLKDFLSKAEAELEKGEYTEAAFQSIAGFNLALNGIKSSIVGFTYLGAEVSLDIEEAINSIKDVLVLPIIGLDYRNYTKYKRLTSHLTVHFMADGAMETNIGGPEPSADDAAFIVNYVVDSVVQIESFVGDIERPFGFDKIEWW